MNILQIGTTDNLGGAANISWVIKRGLEKEGFDMPMFVSKKFSNDKDVFIIPRKVSKYLQYILSNDIDFSKTDWILDTKEFREADIVHLHNLHGWFFNLKTMQKMSELKPIIWTLHDMWAITPHCAHSFEVKDESGFYLCKKFNYYPCFLWNNTRYLSQRKRKIYSNSKMDIVVPSLWLKDKVENSVLGDKKIYLIYNGINENIFKRRDKLSSRGELKIPPHKKILLFISDGGKYNEFKGWSFFESIVKKYKADENILFVCIGGVESGFDPNLKNLLYIPRIYEKSILAKYFSSADIFIYPSIADNCPLIILEAMSCGTPIVTFNTGGIPELVDHNKGGYVAKYKDLNDLINGVEYILNLPADKLDKISNFNINKIKENFTEDIMLNKYRKLYFSIINNQKTK